MVGVEFNQGRTHALAMLQGVTISEAADVIPSILGNIESGQSGRPAQYAEGMQSVIDEARKLLNLRKPIA